MKPTLFVLATAASALLLAGCASNAPLPQPATEKELSDTQLAYANCLVPIAKQIDDGISDAKTIAMGMTGGCPAEFKVMFDTLTRADNSAVKRELWLSQNKLQFNQALNVVLQIRASRTRAAPAR